MTPFFRDKFEAWAEYWISGLGCDLPRQLLTRELLAAYEAEPDPWGGAYPLPFGFFKKDEPRFQKGQLIRLIRDKTETGTVYSASEVVTVDWDDGTRGPTMASGIEPIPDTPKEGTNIAPGTIEECNHFAVHADDGSMPGKCGCGRKHCVCPCECPECVSYAEPDDEIRVGDRVRHDRHGKEGIVEHVHEAKATVRYTLWDSKNALQRELTKLPELPRDHIDRFWVVGAWIRHASWRNLRMKIIPETEMHGLDVGAGTIVSIVRTDLSERFQETGWAFHPQSPIQEQREL